MRAQGAWCPLWNGKGSQDDTSITAEQDVNSSSSYRLAGLVDRASASGAEDPGFESRLRQDFSGSSHTSDLKICAPVATLPGAWQYWVSAGTGRPGVSIL